MRLAGDLETVVQVEDGVKNGVVVGDVDDGAVREHHANAFLKHRVFEVAVKIVGHEKAAAQEILAQIFASAWVNPHSPTWTA